jgi:hypothetical protein
MFLTVSPRLLAFTAAILTLSALLLACGGCPQPPTPPVSSSSSKPGSSASSTSGSSSEPSAKSTTFNGKRFALVIGVQDYDLSNWSKLEYPENDVKEFAGVLRKSGYDDDNVIEMTTGKNTPDKFKPSAAQIMEQLEGIQQKCGANDLLLVALTGHGCQKGDERYFCPSGARKDDNGTWVSLNKVSEVMGQCKARQKVLLVDACRVMEGDKGLLTTDTDDKQVDSVTRGMRVSGLITFVSCAKGEKSWEIGQIKHGQFFDALIRGVRGDADKSGSGKIKWTDLVGFVKEDLAAEKYGHPQHPEFDGNDSGAPIPLAETTVSPKPPKEPQSSDPPRPEPTTIVDGRTFQSGVDRMTITFVNVQLLTNGRMRWNFKIWNKSGERVSFWIGGNTEGDTSYVTDQNGERSKILAHSKDGRLCFDVPEAENMTFWVEYQEPKPGAKTLTAHFSKYLTLSPAHFPPTIDIQLEKPPPPPPVEPSGPATITILFSLGNLQSDAGEIEIEGIKKKWDLSAKKGQEEVVWQLPEPRKYKYKLSSSLTVLLQGKTQKLSATGEGDIDVVNGGKFIYRIDNSKGLNNLSSSLQPPGK